MTPPERDALIDRLAVILGVPRQDLPKVFLADRTKVLKRGIRFDIMQRYSLVDPQALADWLGEYTTSAFYLVRFCQHAQNRHDLDGQDAEKILASERRHAKQKLQAMRYFMTLR